MGRIKTLRIITASFILIMLSGCGNSNYLNKEKINSLNYNGNENNTLVYYKVDYIYSNNHSLRITTHSILRIGTYTKSIPDYFSVYDGSMEKLRSYSCRIIKNDGSTENYNKSDLRSYSLKSSRVISELNMLFVPVEKEITTGDLIEVVYEHEVTLPQLGIEFYMPDYGSDAYNISCSIQIPDKLKLNFLVINDNKIPAVIENDKENTITYLFEWKSINNKKNENAFLEKENLPGVLAAFPFSLGDSDKFTWNDFGLWYLNAIKEKTETDSVIRNKSLEITKSMKTDLEKMNAIFNYCQNSVRYEMVYFAKGEIIPNNCNLILSRKYGDCKDYATLIYSLAKSIGLKSDLALCFRGRGERRFYDIPVSQFNHCIVHYNFEGTDYWYDGTNRSGTPGITTTDLINQTALVLEENYAHLQVIKENPGNRLSISGTLSCHQNDLSGNIKIKLDCQYAVDFLYFEFMLDKTKMESYTTTWLRKNLNDMIETGNMKWSKEGSSFIINIYCKIPNSVNKINNLYYVSIGNIFNKILPAMNEDTPKDLFNYPGYSSIMTDLKVSNLTDNSSLTDNSFRLRYDFKLNPGPYNENERDIFTKNFKVITGDFNNKIKLMKSGNQ